MKVITAEKIRQGDRQAFETLFRTYYRPLCLYAVKYVIDLMVAEEVVQEMFVKLWSGRESLAIKSSFQAYLYRSVHNSCLNHLKHEKVKQQYQEEQMHNVASTTETIDPLEDTELQVQIHRAIDALPVQRQKVFRMSRFEGLKYKEIADQLEISVKTVEVHMGKALRYLREQLTEYLPLLIWILLNKKFW